MSAQRIRTWIDENAVSQQLKAVGGHPFRERRRRGSGLGPVFVTMPGADDAAIENPTFAQWTILVLADVGDRRELVVVAKDGDPFFTQGDDSRSIFGYLDQGTGIDEFSAGAGCRDVSIDLAFPPAGQQMHRQQPEHAETEHSDEDRAGLDSRCCPVTASGSEESYLVKSLDPRMTIRNRGKAMARNTIQRQCARRREWFIRGSLPQPATSRRESATER